MKIIITTNLESRKNQIRDEIDQLREHIDMLMSVGDWNLVKLYQERQNLLITELYDLEAE